MSETNKPKVLIAADDADFRNRITRLLGEAVSEVYETGEIAAALRFIKQSGAALAIVAVNEAEDFGVRLCRRIKGDAKLCSTLILQIVPESLISADGTPKDLACEPDSVIVGPFHQYNFLSHVRMLLRFRTKERDLQARDERYRAFIEQSTEGIWRIEVEPPIPVDITIDEQIELAYKRAYIAECNDAMARMYGWKSASELIGARLGELFVQTDPANYLYLHAFMESGYRLSEAESHERNIDGEDIYFLNNLIGIIEDGKLIRAWGTQRNITERKLAENRLRHSEQKFSTLAAVMPQLVWTATPEGDIDYLNEQWCDYFGVEPERLYEWGWQEVIHPDDLPDSIDDWTRSLETGKPLEIYHRFRHKSGEYRWHLIRGTALTDENDAILKWIGTCTDIHTQREVERALRESEERMRLAMRIADIGTWDYDAVSNKLIWSDSHFTMYGYMPSHNSESSEEMWRNCIHPDDTEHVLADIERAERERALYEGEYRIIRYSDREMRWVSAAGQHFYNEIGETVRFVGVFSDITEQKKAEQEREKLIEREQAARQEAEFANRAKDEFLAVLSHELRTPLNAMYGWARMLSSGTLDESMQRRAVEVIERNTQLQSKLIEDILDISRIVSGKIKLEPHRLDLVGLVKSVVEMSRPSANIKEITLETKVESKFVFVNGDEERLQQILTNLVSNAVKFTPAGGSVTVTLEEHENLAQISVADTGIGISADFLPFVFDRFKQADSSSKRKHGGLGLGLAIVKHLVELHEGNVLVESEGEEKGTTFTITLPLTKPEQLIEKSETQAAPSINGNSQQDWLENLRVLVVEDDPDATEVLRVILEKHGARVSSFHTAKDALNTLQNENYDLILSDIGLPEMDGLEFIGRVRDADNEKIKHLPAVAVTAYASAEDRERVLSAGFNDCVAKPVSFDSLRKSAAQIIKR